MKNLSLKINDIHLKKYINNNQGFSFESFKESTAQKNMAELQQIRSKLNLICMDFDPFIPVIDDQNISYLAEFNLMELTKNPFEFTNTLLRILTIVEQEIKNKLQ